MDQKAWYTAFRLHYPFQTEEQTPSVLKIHPARSGAFLCTRIAASTSGAPDLCLPDAPNVPPEACAETCVSSKQDVC